MTEEELAVLESLAVGTQAIAESLDSLANAVDQLHKIVKIQDRRLHRLEGKLK